MKLRTLAAAAAAITIAATPAIAEASMDRAAAPLSGESKLGGSGTILALLAAAAIIAGIVILADGGSDDPVSA